MMQTILSHFDLSVNRVAVFAYKLRMHDMNNVCALPPNVEKIGPINSFFVAEDWDFSTKGLTVPPVHAL